MDDYIWKQLFSPTQMKQAPLKPEKTENVP